MKNKFAVFDIDGTLIRWQLFHAVVHHLGKRGYISNDTHENIRSARMKWKVRETQNSYSNYERVLVQSYLQALPNIKPKDFQEITQEVFDEYKDQLFVYTRGLLKELKNKGYFLIAISGSQDDIVQKLAKYHGFDVAVGANLPTKDGRFTGEIISPIFNKEQVLKDLIIKHNLNLKGSVGVGDTKGDADILQFVEQPIAFNPSIELYEIAKSKKWPIVIERKDVVYKLVFNGNDYTISDIDLLR